MIDPVYAASESRYERMPYRRCGRSGVLLPALSLGLWHNFGSLKPFQEVKAMAHYAFDHGICHFDLANNYGPAFGTAEENFGKLMATSLKPYRDELFISTKAGWSMWPGPYGNWGSRKYLMASLDQSLKRMNLDYVDVFYSHRYDPATPIEETMQALVDAVRQGKALYAGFSRYPAEQAAEAFRYLAAHDVPCLLYQDRYNINQRTPEEEGQLDLSREYGSGFIAFSPLQQGVLAGRYLNGIPADSRMGRGALPQTVLNDTMLEALRGLDAIARRRGQTLAGMALSWLLRDERVTSVIIGASSVAQIEENLKATEAPAFTEEELQEIETFSLKIRESAR